MPHQRFRLIEPTLLKALRHSPIVGVFGHRQTGKTTQISKLSTRYATLDLHETLATTEDAPLSFLADNPGRPFGIDECQLSPPLFPALKEHVRRNPRPGQFLLTGSVRYLSRKQIRESLTGRIMNFELTPMGPHETEGIAPDQVWKQVIQKIKPNLLLERKPLFTLGQIKRYSSHGGLPGIFSIRDPKIMRQKRESLIETLLERDLRLLIQTSIDYRVLRNLLGILSRNSGSALDMTALSSHSGISVPALKRLLSAFQAMFLIRIISTLGDQKRPVIFFEDPGEKHHLRDSPPEELDLLGALFTGLRPLFDYHLESPTEFFQYRTRGGAFIPLVLKTQSTYVGFLASPFDGATAKQIQSANSFLSNFKRSMAIIVHQGKRTEVLRENLILAPVQYVF